MKSCEEREVLKTVSSVWKNKNSKINSNCRKKVSKVL